MTGMKFAVFPLAAALLVSAPAAAQPTDPVAAAALFQEAREARKRGDDQTACAKFAESLRLDPAPGTLLNLADCEERTGKPASAWQHFRLALDKLPAQDERRGPAEARAAALLPRLPRLTITLAAGAPAGSRVLRDGVELGAASVGSALPLDPGEHGITLVAPGYAPRVAKIILVEGRTEHIEMAPGDPLPKAKAPEEKAPEEKAPTSRGPSGLRVAGLVLGSVGIVGFGVALGTGLALPSAKKEADAGCGQGGRSCDADAWAAVTRGKTLLAANTAGFLVGVVGLGAGVTLFAVGGKSASASASGWILPGGGGAALAGRF